MLLVKINEFKYQVLKYDQKNSITMPYEDQKQIAIYEAEGEATKKYVNISDVEATITSYVDIDTRGHDDYILSFDLYLDEDGKCSALKFDMQATVEQTVAAENSDDVKEKNVDDVLARLKISDEEKSKALDLQLKLTSNNQDIQAVEAYRDYLKSGEIKRKLMAKMKRSVPTLSDSLMTKYNTIICFLPEIEDLLINTELSQPEKEMIVDYIYVSRYRVLKFEKLFLSELPQSNEDKEIIIHFISNSKALLKRLETNPDKITKALDFIASSLNAIAKMTKTNHFDRQITEFCNNQTKQKLDEINELIARDFEVIGTVVKGEK